MAKAVKKEQVQNAVASLVVDSEYATAKRNMDVEISRFESLIDQLECSRMEKDYDWMSDYYLPVMNSIFHTERAGEVAQYFPTRDFVDVKLDSDSPEDKIHSDAAKICVNKTLNRRNLYYYQKFVRHRSINSLFGQAYKVCWWEYEERTDELQTKDAKGKPTAVTRKRILKDQFNFDVVDPRNVFTDNKYTYSIQEKDWVIIRSEGSYEELKAQEKTHGYINLDKVKEALSPKKSKGRAKATETNTAKESYDKEGDNLFIADTAIQRFDLLNRYGKFWAVVREIDENEGFPTEAEIGMNEDGSFKENAELVEAIITFAIIGNERIMIRFAPTPFVDSNGEPFKPIVRSLCYVHPTKDGGLGDGQHMREMQIVLNDNVNMAADRTKLATLPTFIGQDLAMEDSIDDVYFEPEHVIRVPDINASIRELKITDNISGAIQQNQMITGAMYQVMGIFPPQMGGLPDKASTTATAVAGSEANKNTRASYKSLTYEFTDLTEFYGLILQMSWRFMKTSTALKLFGPELAHKIGKRWADENYTYTPLSSNIEAEYSKFKKAQHLDQAIGRLSGLAKGVPKVIPLIAYMTGKQIDYLVGDDDPMIKKMVDEFAKSEFSEEGKQPNQVADQPDGATSNQTGAPISPQEQAAREGGMTGGGQINNA